MDLITRQACVRWKGGGTAVTVESGVLKQAKIALSTRLKRDSDTDPGELIAATHASSFALALSNELGLRAFATGEIVTTATVTVEHLAADWAVRKIHLDVVATLPKMTQDKFIEVAVRAKTNCLVSKLVRANVSMTAKLERSSDRDGADGAIKRTTLSKARSKAARLSRNGSP